MINLFIDTSSSDVSIAIVKEKKILASISKETPTEHSVYTIKYLDDVLKNANIKANEIDKIMVANGPGSFTGVRIGVTIAKTYAYLLNKKIIAISSLKMLALSTEHNYIMSLIDARNNNYYMGLYDKNNNEILKEQFIHIDQLLEIINQYNPKIVSDNNIVVDGINIPKQHLDFIKIVEYYKDKETFNPHSVVPNYLKLPQAMENKK